MLLPLKTILRLALFGLIFGPLLDYLHVHNGAITYPYSPGAIAWWVPLEFSAGCVFVAAYHLGFDRVRGHHAPPPSTRSLIASMLVFGLVWWLTGALSEWSSAYVTLVAAPTALLALVLFDGTLHGAVLALFTAVGGMAFEANLVRLGFFAHKHTDVAGVPLWLPCIYLTASVAVGKYARWLAHRTDRTQPAAKDA